MDIRIAGKPAAKTSAKYAAMLGMLCALSAAIAFLESMLPALPIPGARLGLSNIVTMAAMSGMGVPAAAAVVLVKGVFALMRGGVACAMSLSGGIASVTAMTVLHKTAGQRDKISFIGLGAAGAAAHQLGQLAAASVITGGGVWALTPALLMAGLAAGILTGTILNHISLLIKGAR